MSQVPTVPFGPIEISRLIVGGNPFCGNSHVDESMSRDMRQYYTAENVVAALHACQAAGINQQICKVAKRGFPAVYE